jgi:hypothetical protein
MGRPFTFLPPGGETLKTYATVLHTGDKGHVTMFAMVWLPANQDEDVEIILAQKKTGEILQATITAGALLHIELTRVVEIPLAGYEPGNTLI